MNDSRDLLGEMDQRLGVGHGAMNDVRELMLAVRWRLAAALRRVTFQVRHIRTPDEAARCLTDLDALDWADPTALHAFMRTLDLRATWPVSAAQLGSPLLSKDYSLNVLETVGGTVAEAVAIHSRRLTVADCEYLALAGIETRVWKSVFFRGTLTTAYWGETAAWICRNAQRSGEPVFHFWPELWKTTWHENALWFHTLKSRLICIEDESHAADIQQQLWWELQKNLPTSGTMLSVGRSRADAMEDYSETEGLWSVSLVTQHTITNTRVQPTRGHKARQKNGKGTSASSKTSHAQSRRTQALRGLGAHEQKTLADARDGDETPHVFCRAHPERLPQISLSRMLTDSQDTYELPIEVSMLGHVASFAILLLQFRTLPQPQVAWLAAAAEEIVKARNTVEAWTPHRTEPLNCGYIHGFQIQEWCLSVASHPEADRESMQRFIALAVSLWQSPDGTQSHALYGTPDGLNSETFDFDNHQVSHEIDTPHSVEIALWNWWARHPWIGTSLLDDLFTSQIVRRIGPVSQLAFLRQLLLSPVRMRREKALRLIAQRAVSLRNAVANTTQAAATQDLKTPDTE